VICCLLASCAPKEDEAAPSKPSAAMTTEDVRYIRENRAEARESKCGTCAASIREEIYRRLEAPRLIAAAEFMLANPENSEEVADAFHILSRCQGDRKRFVEPALRAVSHEDPWVRRSAAYLLGEIGTRNEAPALTKLLADSNLNVASAAVNAIAAIGGPDALVALDAFHNGLDQDAAECGRRQATEGRTK